MQRRLLILKCSNRKRNGAELLPAIERYDGPLWQVLRNAQREQPLLVSDIDVYVLSAAFGLIPASQPIAWYDQTMSPERADEIRPSALATLATVFEVGYSELCLGLSHRYLRALSGWENIVPPTVQITLTDGPMGVKLGQLHAWLSGETWEPPKERPERLVAAAEPRGSVQLKGHTITFTRDQVMAQARQALLDGRPGADRFQDWFVVVDGQRVAAKWVVSVLSGLSTKEFDAAAAQRVLLALGVDVERAVS